MQRVRLGAAIAALLLEGCHEQAKQPERWGGLGKTPSFCFASGSDGSTGVGVSLSIKEPILSGFAVFNDAFRGLPKQTFYPDLVLAIDGEVVASGAHPNPNRDGTGVDFAFVPAKFRKLLAHHPSAFTLTVRQGDRTLAETRLGNDAMQAIGQAVRCERQERLRLSANS